MLVPGIFKLGLLSIRLQIWHLDFMHFLSPVKVGVVEIFCLSEHLLSICAERSAVEQVFGGRHVAVAFPFCHNGFVSGDNFRMVCLY